MDDSPPNAPRGSTDAERIVQTAGAAFQAGRIQEAEAMCLDAIRNHPGRPEPLFALGLVLANSGRADQAIETLKQALAVDPNYFPALDWLGYILRATGALEEAAAVSRQATKLRPNEAGPHNTLGLCYLAQQRILEASASFERAVALNPNDALHHHNLGITQQLQGRNIEAARSYRRALSLAPKFAETHIRLGQLLLEEGDRAAAVACFERASASDPGSTTMHLLWAQALLELGRDEEAEEHLKIAAAGDAAANVELGLMLQESGRFADAVASFERAIRAEPNKGGAYHGLARGRKMTDADQPLIDTMESILSETDLTPDDRSMLHYALGKTYEDLKNYEEAMSHFNSANQIAAGHVNTSFDKKAHEAYIDKTIARFSKKFFEDHQDLGSESELPLFIVGMIRSGTTLAEQVVSTHPRIGAGGELRFWYEREPALLTALDEGILDSATTSQMAQNYEKLLRGIAPGKARVTDKMPLNFMLLGLIHTVFPKARIIHCRRNPLDNCLSIYTTFFRISPLFAHEPDNIIFFYEQYLRLMDHWRKVFPAGTMLELDYEELVADRERITREMIAFSGLEWDDAVLHHENNQRTVRTPSFWQVRQPIYNTSVARWRRYEPWLGSFAKLLRP